MLGTVRLIFSRLQEGKCHILVLTLCVGSIDGGLGKDERKWYHTVVHHQRVDCCQQHVSGILVPALIQKASCLLQCCRICRQRKKGSMNAQLADERSEQDSSPR